MATAVVDINIEDLPRDLQGLDGYLYILALVRFGGCPVGKIRVPVENGCVTAAQIRAALLEMDLSPLWNAWLAAYTGYDPVAGGQPPASVTVATCTRDRPEDLARCLAGVLNLPEDGQEILVVDNHPQTDQTRRLVQSYPRVRYIREDRPGLDVARNRALREARGEVVAFIDDDAIPDPGWLRALVRHFADPRVMAVTGLTMPGELETEAQEMFERYSGFGRGFYRYTFNINIMNPLVASRVGAGANMALRTSVLDRVGAFDEALDAGTPTQSGGDTEMFTRILRAGYSITYEPAALNWHWHRRAWPDLRRVLYGYGVGAYAIWTRQLLREGEFSVLRHSAAWWWKYQLPGLLRAILRPSSSPIPAQLLWDEIRGCLAGPWAYLRSSRSLSQGRKARA